MKPEVGVKLMDEENGTCSAAPRSGQLLRVVLQAQLALGFLTKLDHSILDQTAKELSFCYTLKLSNPNIFAT